jgi:AcrR family transcriptional regulator
MDGTSIGLRERKKSRRRQRIILVALELFSKQGYQETTLAEIANAVEIAPSTLHAYFRAKDDILFSVYDTVRASASLRIVERPEGESLIEALHSWVSYDLPNLVGDGESIRFRRGIIDRDSELLVQERLRFALLEDVFAEAFARDLGESAEDLRSRLLASVVISGLRAVWFWWYSQQPGDAVIDPTEVYSLDAKYLTRVVEAAGNALEAIPSPQEHLQMRRVTALRAGDPLLRVVAASNPG